MGRTAAACRSTPDQGRELCGSGRALPAARLYDERERSARAPRVLVQEWLRGHPELERLSGTRTLQTLRIVTLVKDSGEPWVCAAFLRIVTGDALIDNFDGGRTGNLCALADPTSGVLDAALGRDRRGVSVEAHARHPRTDLPLAGFTVPDFVAARELALRAARLFLPLRSVGWDVAPTESGPVLIEGNVNWDPIGDLLVRTRSEETWRRWLNLLQWLQSPERGPLPRRRRRWL